MAEADHYSHIAHCIMCMKGCEAANRQQCYYALHCLGGERLYINPKGSGSLPAPRSDQATTNMVFFPHLLILEDPDHHQILSVFHCTTQDPSTTFHHNQFITF